MPWISRLHFAEKVFDFRVEIHGYRNQVERIFREVQRRTYSFSNCFSDADPTIAEAWLQATAVWWKSSLN
jgi:putative transposase